MKRAVSCTSWHRPEMPPKNSCTAPSSIWYGAQPERLSPATQQGTHDYEMYRQMQKYAQHTFTNYYTRYASELISLADHKGLNGENKVGEAVAQANKAGSKVEFFKVTTSEGVEMDAWMVKPDNFDATKKYPVVFYVYTEPWGQNVKD